MESTFPHSRGRAAAWLALGALGPLALAQAATAQDYTGLALSNYAGTNAAYVNPSAIADSRHRFYLNVLGLNAAFSNTYLQLNLRQQPWESGFSLTKSDLTEQGGNGPYAGHATAEVRLPSFLLTLGPRSAVAFTSRARAFVRADNVSEPLAQLARYGLGDAQRLALAGRLLTDNQFSLHADAYHEFALTYARTLTPNTRHFFKAGLTLKYLVGLGSSYVRNEGTTFRVLDGTTLELQNRQLSYGLTDFKQYKDGFSKLYGDQALGHGYGADLGLTYEWRPDYARYAYHMDGTDWLDNSRNKYRLRLGLALTDLGAIGYRGDGVRQGQVANGGTRRLGQLDTLQFRNLQATENTLDRLVGLSSRGREFTSYLPAALRLTADYHLAGPLYAGLLWTQSLLPARTIGSRTSSLLALTPRVEFRRLELAVPLVLADGYHRAQVGAMLRLGPLIVGSDNLGGLLGLGSATGADAYFGLALALQRHRHKDRDRDGVSNQYDKCPRQKGTWECRGCADRDHDGVPDTADACPDVAGLAQLKGCPAAEPTASPTPPAPADLAPAAEPAPVPAALAPAEAPVSPLLPTPTPPTPTPPGS